MEDVEKKYNPHMEGMPDGYIAIQHRNMAFLYAQIALQNRKRRKQVDKQAPILTNDTYFSPECQMYYMGASQYKAFKICEAAALAEIEGRYTSKQTTDQLIGSYIDAYFEGNLNAFQKEHPEIFKKDGSLKSEYIQAESIISRLEKDELYMLLMSGKKQVIKTGKIAGVPYKIKVDSLLDETICKKITEKFPATRQAMGFCEGAIVDQKIMKNMSDIWSEEEGMYVPFFNAWGYDIQGAIYQAVEGHMLPFILAVATKEKEADMEAICISDTRLAIKLDEVERFSPRYQAIKQHKIEPIKCGHCSYCKSQKRLTGIEII